MTQVDFHIGIEDPVAYCCRLVRKVLATGSQALIVADAALLQHLDAALWADAPSGFTPHAMADAPPAVVARSPVVLAVSVPVDLLPHAVLINLTSRLPDDSDTRDRIVELVSDEEDAVKEARVRWKTYKQRGHELVNHDVRERAKVRGTDSG